MKTKSWFRVVVDDKGKVKDCKPVSSAGTADAGIFFVLAGSARQAAKSAARSHDAQLLAARRARYEAEGLCKCGRERDRQNPDGGLFKVCSGCAERHAIHEGRKQARARGEAVPPLDRRTVLLERKEQEAASVRLSALIDVQRAYTRNRNNHRAFERWLGQQIEAVTGKAVA